MIDSSRLASFALLALPLLAGCGAGDDPPAGTASLPDGGAEGDAADSGSEPATCANTTTIALHDENNYRFEGALSIRSHPLAPLGDPLIDWSGLTRDLQGHALSPATELDYSAIVVLANLTKEQVQERLSTNTLDQSYITAYVSVDLDGDTSARMSDYAVFGNDIDIETFFEPGYGVWLLTLATGTTPGVGTRMAAFLEPDAAASATVATIGNDSTTLAFDADLHSLTRVPAPPGKAALTVDWSAVTSKGDGSPFAAGDVDRLTLGHYSSMTASDLESRFLDLEQLADETWTASVIAGSRADLADLSSATGAFTGISDQGVWLLALRCTTCANPAPPFLTILEPCPAD